MKKHSNLLGESVHDLLDASDVEMDDEFWHEILDFYFIRGRVSKGRQEDDLLFFVRSTVIVINFRGSNASHML